MTALPPHAEIGVVARGHVVVVLKPVAPRLVRERMPANAIATSEKKQRMSKYHQIEVRLTIKKMQEMW